MSAPGFVPAFRCVRARVTSIANDASDYGGRPAWFCEADALHEPSLHFAFYARAGELPAIGQVVTFRVGPGDALDRMPPRSVAMVHFLKCERESFRALRSLAKKHETRVADRDYRVGDILELAEIEAVECPVATGNIMRRRITYVTEGGTWGLPATLCVLSVEPIAGEMRGEEWARD